MFCDVKFFHLTRAGVGGQHHVALASGFVPKVREGKSLQFRRATGSVPFNRRHTSLYSRRHVKKQRFFFKIIYFIERQNISTINGMQLVCLEKMFTIFFV